jgi:hypothetical protein
VTEFRARIGRIRMKNGGADVRVLNRNPDGAASIDPNGEDWRGTVVRNARAVADMATSEAPLVGYLLIGFYGDGCTSVGFRYDVDRCPVPRALMPSWVAEIIRRDMITEPDTRDVFNDMFYWRDGA